MVSSITLFSSSKLQPIMSKQMHANMSKHAAGRKFAEGFGNKPQMLEFQVEEYGKGVVASLNNGKEGREKYDFLIFTTSSI